MIMTSSETQPNWKYIVAWILYFGSVNVMDAGTMFLLLPLATDGVMSFDFLLWISVGCSFLFLLSNCYVIYEKLFSGLNPHSVWKWMVGLGTFFTMSNLGNSISPIEEVVADATPYVFTQFIFWIVFLFLYRYYYKEVKKSFWGKLN